MTKYPDIDPAPEAAVRARYTAICEQIGATNENIARLTNDLVEKQKARETLLNESASGEIVPPDAHASAEQAIREAEAALMREKAIAARREEIRAEIEKEFQPARAVGHRARIISALREWCAAGQARHEAVRAVHAATEREAGARAIITDALNAGWPWPAAWVPVPGQTYTGVRVPDSMNEKQIREVFRLLAAEALGPVHGVTWLLVRFLRFSRLPP